MPCASAISEAASTFKDEKEKRGRKTGWRKTTKDEDKIIIQKFHHLRPPGHYVDSRMVKSALPKKVKEKVSRRTVIRRLADKGFHARKKLDKQDYGPKWRAARVKFARGHTGLSKEQWQTKLQAVGDITEFVWYPKAMQPRHRQLRAKWTYMTEEERWKPAYSRPKRWYPASEYKKVVKFKVFGLTASTGKSLVFLWPHRCTAEKWAPLVKKRVIPFLQKEFPNKRPIQLLLDGEKLLHAPVAKALFDAAGIKSKLKEWPFHSPDINPQEHVWGWAEPRSRHLQDEGNGTFEEYQKATVKACKDYPSGHKLIPSMPSRIQEVIDRKGAAINR